MIKATALLCLMLGKTHVVSLTLLSDFLKHFQNRAYIPAHAIYLLNYEVTGFSKHSFKDTICLAAVVSGNQCSCGLLKYCFQIDYITQFHSKVISQFNQNNIFSTVVRAMLPPANSHKTAKLQLPN